MADRAGGQRLDDPAAGGRDVAPRSRLGQARRVVEDARVAPLRGDEAAEAFEGRAVGDRPAAERAGVVERIGALAHDDHLGGQLDREVEQVGRPVAPEAVDALGHLDRVAHGAAERLVHPGDQGPHPLAQGPADGAHRPRQVARVVEPLHERAVARLDVEHQAVDPLGQLLRHDRGRDQGDRLDRRRRVAEGVEPLVGRGDLGGLADQDEAALVEHRLVAVEVEVDAEAGDRLELVERAAGVAQPAARDHRHRHARPPPRSAPGSARSCRRRPPCCACRSSGRGSPTGRRPIPTASSRRSGRRSRPRPSRARRSPSAAPTTGNRPPRRAIRPSTIQAISRLVRARARRASCG